MAIGLVSKKKKKEINIHLGCAILVFFLLERDEKKNMRMILCNKQCDFYDDCNDEKTRAILW